MTATSRTAQSPVPMGKRRPTRARFTYAKDANGETTRTQTTEVTGPNGQVHTGSNSETYNQSFTPSTPPAND